MISKTLILHRHILIYTFVGQYTCYLGFNYYIDFYLVFNAWTIVMYVTRVTSFL